MYPFSIFGTDAPDVAWIFILFFLKASPGFSVFISVKPILLTTLLAACEDITGILLFIFSSVGGWAWSGWPWVSNKKSMLLGISTSLASYPFISQSPGGKVKSPFNQGSIKILVLSNSISQPFAP